MAIMQYVLDELLQKYSIPDIETKEFGLKNQRLFIDKLIRFVNFATGTFSVDANIAGC